MPQNRPAFLFTVALPLCFWTASAQSDGLSAAERLAESRVVPAIEFRHSPSVSVRRRAGTLWSRVGILRVARNNRIQQGTAFLVSRCLAVTAAHTAVSGKSLGAVGQVHLFFGRNLKFEADGLPLAWGTYYRRRTQKANGDWAVLRVKPCLGKKLGYLRLEPLPKTTAIKLGSRLRSAGHPSARSEKFLTVSSNCRIITASDRRLGGWLNDCSLRRGGSGGPILWKNRVIAVATAETATFQGRLRAKASRRFANIAVPVRDILARLRAYHPGIHAELIADQKRMDR